MKLIYALSIAIMSFSAVAAQAQSDGPRRKRILYVNEILTTPAKINPSSENEPVKDLAINKKGNRAIEASCLFGSLRITSYPVVGGRVQADKGENVGTFVTLNMLECSRAQNWIRGVNFDTTDVQMAVIDNPYRVYLKKFHKGTKRPMKRVDIFGNPMPDEIEIVGIQEHTRIAVRAVQWVAEEVAWLGQDIVDSIAETFDPIEGQDPGTPAPLRPVAPGRAVQVLE